MSKLNPLSKSDKDWFSFVFLISILGLPLIAMLILTIINLIF